VARSGQGRPFWVHGPKNRPHSRGPTRQRSKTIAIQAATPFRLASMRRSSSAMMFR
jgi:hypothetical protein